MLSLWSYLHRNVCHAVLSAAPPSGTGQSGDHLDRLRLSSASHCGRLWPRRAHGECLGEVHRRSLQAVHEYLVEHLRDLLHVQVEEIRVKLQGVIVWLAMALQVNTRLWLGAVVSEHRDEDLIQAVIQIVSPYALARPLLISVDGLRSYVGAIQDVFW
jgi:hypothetical protein